MGSKKTYQDALNRMAYIMSHRVRQPIVTMSGLVGLMEQDLVTEDECTAIILDMRKCLGNDFPKHPEWNDYQSVLHLAYYLPVSKCGTTKRNTNDWSRKIAFSS